MFSLEETLQHMNKKLILIVALLIVACDPDNNNEIQASSSLESVNPVEVQNILQPYSIHLENKHRFASSSKEIKPNSRFLKEIDIEQLSYENISNTNAKMAVVPATIKYDDYYSRVLLLKIDGKVETVAFNTKQDPYADDENFTGEMVISDLDGNYLRGFKVINGMIVMLYLPESPQTTQNASLLTALSIGSLLQNDFEWEIELEEVEVWGTLPSNRFEIEWVFTSLYNYDDNVFEGGGNSWTNEKDYRFWDSAPKEDGVNHPPNNEEEEEEEKESCKSGEIRDENGKCIDEELFNFLNSDVWNQNNPYDDWNRLTECEKDFFKNNPHHLYTAVGNKKAAEKASWNRFSECNTPNGNPMHNTIGDAYRHAYFAALNTHNMGYKNAQVLGDAHECDDPPHKSNEKQMDLHNNNWGYHYGSTVSYVNEKQFYDSFMDAFNKGQIKILEECQ